MTSPFNTAFPTRSRAGEPVRHEKKLGLDEEKPGQKSNTYLLTSELAEKQRGYVLQMLNQQSQIVCGYRVAAYTDKEE